MKANELRIGNYVQSIGIIYQVLSIDFKGNIKGIEGNTSFNLDESAEPIPLTEEWLFKFGFSTNDFNENCFWKNYSNQGEIILFSNKTPLALSNNIKEPFYFSFNNVIYGIKHVHQIQNLYFALTVEELTIKE